MNKKIFTMEQCDTLFEAILADDNIDLTAEAPTSINLDYDQGQIEQCFQICLQLWEDGVERDKLVKIVKKTYQIGILDDIEKLRFKYIRAKCKHLRFACAIFGKQHHYTMLFQFLTGLMGNLQDAFKNSKKNYTVIFALLVRLFLWKHLYKLSTRILHQLPLSTVDGVRDFIISDIIFLRTHLFQEKITSKQFHDMRKVVSRQVSLYSNLMVLYPSAEHMRIFRYLSTINGLMGNMHDELILRKFEKVSQYYLETIDMPIEIKERLMVYVDCYSLPL
ncbi:MAG: hypothetical protein COW84_04630 [Gammaproteobacteria bacterium CG22_combo_CG10-13_8_21_14_all_40_8]|nr:MAG: hypothetical protein COW84_04630 [Gammaproteobacteria bacterium CG22_combo_CG10-13_8_21_14_all_40_8]